MKFRENSSFKTTAQVPTLIGESGTVTFTKDKGVKVFFCVNKYLPASTALLRKCLNFTTEMGNHREEIFKSLNLEYEFSLCGFPALW